MARRSTSWVRGLGWILALGFVLGGSLWLTWGIHISLTPWAILPSLFAAFLIGRHIKDWWWAAGAGLAAVPAAVLGVGLLIAAFVSAVNQVGPLGSGGGTANAIMIGSVVTGAAVVAGVLHALAAIAGVWHGTRRTGLPDVPVAIAAGVPARAATDRDNAR